MEENVALDSSKQKKFVKSIKGIKKLIKKNEKEEEEAVDKTLFSVASKDVTKVKKRKFPRGLVYLSHIPHGFYEHQMTQYFKQFGVVTNARVIRSKRTGRSKGFAFVEFKEPSVAQIVAETMNNYLMGKRLIKAVYIPPEKQRRNAMRKHWNDINNPGNKLRMEIKKNFNADKDDKGELKRARKLLSNLNKTKKKLKEIGIDYDFFTPVDIPKALLKNMVKSEKGDEDTIQVKDEKTKKKKNKKTEIEDSKVSETNKQDNKTVKKTKLKKEEINKKDVSKVNIKDNKNEKVEEEHKKVKVKEQKLKHVPEVNKKQQKQKEDNLKVSGIKHMGDFVKVGQNSDNDSDSSTGFDSDEYEKAMGSDDEFNSEDDQSDDSVSNDEEIDDIESESEDESPVILPPAKKGKGKRAQNKSEMKKLNKPETKQQQLNKINEQQNKKRNKEMKRKAPQSQAGSPKKLKFEKQKNQKQVKKLIKVKK